MIPVWNEKPLDLILVGAVSKDEMIYKNDVQKFWGGAVIYGAWAANSSGARVGVITKAANKDHQELRTLGIPAKDLKILSSPQSTSIRNIYYSEDRERRTCKRLSAIDPFLEDELKGAKSKIIHAAALMRGEISFSTLTAMQMVGEVALDAQGFIRVAREGQLILEPWSDWQKVLSSVSYLKADAAEAEIITGEKDIIKSALIISGMGPREVVVSYHKEIILVYRGDIFKAPLTNRGLDGRTGRGDTLFCSYLARRALGESPGQALEFAAALTSIKLETPGPFCGTITDIEQRIIQTKIK